MLGEVDSNCLRDSSLPVPVHVLHSLLHLSDSWAKDAGQVLLPGDLQIGGENLKVEIVLPEESVLVTSVIAQLSSDEPLKECEGHVVGLEERNDNVANLFKVLRLDVVHEYLHELEGSVQQLLLYVSRVLQTIDECNALAIPLVQSEDVRELVLRNDSVHSLVKPLHIEQRRMNVCLHCASSWGEQEVVIRRCRALEVVRKALLHRLAAPLSLQVPWLSESCCSFHSGRWRRKGGGVA
mmetsp:Transcript_16351/g.63825  ORF Transcript_16351/g.63825 Transcript_16351/m.63825 type:complete len:238 (-) Transcript_16351:281-994(-)